MSIISKLTSTNNFKNRYKLPESLFWIILLICIVPPFLAIIAARSNFWINNNSNEVLANTSLGHTIFNIWLILGIGAAMITGGMSFVDYYVKREISTPLVGCILFTLGVFDMFHLFIANRVISISEHPIADLYATWSISRLLHAVLLSGSTLYFVLNVRFIKGLPRRRWLLFYAGSIFFLITAVLIAGLTLSTNPFQANAELYKSLSYQAIPAIIFLLWGVFLLPIFQQRYPSIFSRTLILSVIPAVLAELAMVLHNQPFDTLFNTAYFLRFLSYMVPMLGISMNYIETIKKEKNIIQSLDVEIQERLAAQKKLEKREALLVNAERIAHLGSWEFNITSNELKWSDEMFNIHGYAINAINPTMIFQEQIVSKLHRDKVKNAFNTAIRNRSSYTIEYQVRRPNGDLRFLLGQGNFLKRSNKLVGTVLDITELKEAQYNLEVKIQELNRSNNELEQFAYVASHDLREPLRKIKTFGERLRNKYGNLLPPEAVDYIERMANASVRMQILIDDLLTLSKVSRTDEEKEKVILAEVINGVINDLEVSIEKTNAQIGVLVNHNIAGLTGQIRQLFQNLISNALKFSRPGIRPEITISSFTAESHTIKNYPNTLAGADYCKITVTDNGIGFNAEYKQKIFILFERLHSRNEYEGTGIGLAVCKKIIENHNGLILAESEEGMGTTFTIYLPLFN